MQQMRTTLVKTLPCPRSCYSFSGNFVYFFFTVHFFLIKKHWSPFIFIKVQSVYNEKGSSPSLESPRVLNKAAQEKGDLILSYPNKGKMSIWHLDYRKLKVLEKSFISAFPVAKSRMKYNTLAWLQAKPSPQKPAVTRWTTFSPIQKYTINFSKQQS